MILVAPMTETLQFFQVKNRLKAGSVPKPPLRMKGGCCFLSDCVGFTPGPWNPAGYTSLDSHRKGLGK